MKIYCLINDGQSLDEEIFQLLFESAQEVMGSNNRTLRIALPSRELTGEITTEYKTGFMGSVVGFIFTARIDWDGGSSKTDLIDRSAKGMDKTKNIRWVRAPLFPLMPDPVLN